MSNNPARERSTEQKGRKPAQHEATMCVVAASVTNEDDLFLHLFSRHPRGECGVGR